MPLKLQQMKRLFKYWLKRRLVLGVDVESVRSKIFSRELAMGGMKVYMISLRANARSGI